MNLIYTNKTKLIIILAFSLFIINAKAQDNVKDSKQMITGFSGNFSYERPGGDLVSRFGGNFNVGAGFFRKTKSNYFFTLEGGYIFGSNIKDSLFHLIKTHDSYIIDGNGMYADVRTYERGFVFWGKAGKIFPVLKKDNPNSGLLVMIGGGFMQHKIRIENPGNTVLELKGDYKKGYDKLTNGPALSEFLGYIHFSDSRLYNFRMGFEFTEAFTKARRNFDLDLMTKDTKKRIDLLYGFKVCWMIPVNRRKPSEFYYN